MFQSFLYLCFTISLFKETNSRQMVSYCISFWSLQRNKCNGAFDDGTMWCQSWCQQYHVTPAHEPVVSHDQTVMSHLFWLSQHKNAMMPLKILSASCDADVGNCGITWVRNSWCTLFQLSWPKHYNGTIDDAISINWRQCKWHYRMKKIILHPFLIILP